MSTKFYAIRVTSGPKIQPQDVLRGHLLNQGDIYQVQVLSHQDGLPVPLTACCKVLPNLIPLFVKAVTLQVVSPVFPL